MKALSPWSAARVSVRLTQSTHFLTPCDSTVAPPSGTDHVVNGTATIHLRKSTYVRQLRVVLTGTANLHYGGHEHTIETLRQELNFDIFSELKAGDHSFAFDFVLPPNTAVHERSRYGRVVHKVRASVDGLGLLGATITDEKRFLIVAVPPSAGSSSQPGLDIDIQGYHEDIGPYRIRASSELLAVGGLLLYSLTLFDPPEGAEILKTDGSFRQTAIVRTPDGQEHRPTPTVRRCFLVDAMREPDTNTPPLRVPDIHQPPVIPLPEAPLTTLDGQIWSIQHLARVPDDNLLRASTLPGTITPIEMTHELQIDIVYRNAQGVERVMTAVRPVTLLSCCARFASVILPEYSADVDEKAILAGILKSTTALGFVECMCGLSANEVFEEQGGAGRLFRVSSDDIDTQLAREGPKVGELDTVE